jgi:hypothetical protein
MNHYLGVARKLKIPEEQIGTVEAIVMAVAAGRVNAQFREARKENAPQSTRRTRRKQFD